MSVALPPVDAPVLGDDLEQYRLALTRYCTRMLGSRSEAEDAVQETMLRAWRHQTRFERRSALYSWLHRIATNVCIDMLNGRSRRAMPVDPASLQSAAPAADAATDPVAQTLAQETLRLALLAAIERLPARQRAVLLLRDVLSWKASEVAELFDTSSAAVNSALHRARAALESLGPGAGDTTPTAAVDSSRELLASYLAAFDSGHGQAVDSSATSTPLAA